MPKLPKLGKPQKSSRHKKLKAIDPFYEGNRAVDRKANQVNQCPKNKDAQEVSHSLREMLDLKRKAKSMLKKKKQVKKKQEWKKAPKEKTEKGMTRPLKPVPTFRQGKRETDRDFLNRVEKETEVVLAKSRFEKKYKIDLDAKPGEQVVKKRSSEKKRERLKQMKLKKKEQLAKKKDNRKSGFEELEDEVEFGEVAMEPPSLTAKPRKSNPIDPDAKPGKKNLLLNQILLHNKSQNPTAPMRRQVGKSVKRKMLSPCQQNIMDGERNKAIQQYRLLKKKKMDSAS